MKKLTAILLAILMLIPIIASCGGNDETTITETPTTEAPTTETPTTERPTTEAPTTEAPSTEAPPTEAPTTEAPTTEIPTTEAPTTEIPTTEAPTTDNNDNIDNVENPWDSIYIAGLRFVDNDSRFNFKNIFDANPKHLDDSDNVSSQVTININGEDIIFNYDESIYYPIQSVMTHQYKGVTDETQHIIAYLYEDGTVESLSGTRASNDPKGLAYIKISENTTLEELLPSAKDFLSQFTDLSQYKLTKYEKDVLSGWYKYIFYNEVNGYITEQAKIQITDTGIVASIDIIKINKEITSLNVNKEKLEEYLIKRIKDMYSTDFVEFISCEISQNNYVRIIRSEEIYLSYPCYVKYKFKDGSEEFTTERNFLIPYELVKAE